VEKQEELEKDPNLSPQDLLHAQLQGPCNNLRLINIEARISDVGLVEEAKEWSQKLMEQAYTGVKPYRKLKVLINPVGGPGKALQLFASRIRPVLEAAGCILDLTVTKYVNHGLEIARSLSLKDGFDAIVCVSGDGMLHEVLNGLAQRKDALEALKIPVAPIPTGSGNAVALNLLGVEQGFNLALACLNLIKGNPMRLDVCSRCTRCSD
jgi:sphingosine kinase